jgi:hypothetical protein
MVLPWFNSRVPLMVISFAASSSFLSIRLGRWELFAQRETAPATRYGFTRDPISGGMLDLVSCGSGGYSQHKIGEHHLATN